MMKEVLDIMNNARVRNSMDMANEEIKGIFKLLFTDWIVSEPKSKDFVMASFAKFGGSSDPSHHILQF